MHSDPVNVQRPAADACGYQRYRAGGWEIVHGAVIRESAVTVFVNQRELVTILCTPLRLNHLVLGFLANEGLIESLDDVAMMRVCDEESAVEVRLSREPPPLERRALTSGCGGAYTAAQQAGRLPAVCSDVSVTAEQILALIKRLHAASTLFQQYGGSHSAALAVEDRLLTVAEDVGRHNCVDKLRGWCLLEGVASADRILLTTGRLSSEIVAKAAKMGVPVLVSRNSATSRAASLAASLGITLVGYARASSLTLYTHPERVAGAGQREES